MKWNQMVAFGFTQKVWVYKTENKLKICYFKYSLKNGLIFSKFHSDSLLIRYCLIKKKLKTEGFYYTSVLRLFNRTIWFTKINRKQGGCNSFNRLYCQMMGFLLSELHYNCCLGTLCAPNLIWSWGMASFDWIMHFEFSILLDLSSRQ